jgi:DNA-binding NtrC family response regulator
VFGRNPDGQRLDAAVGITARAHHLPFPSVSSNHLAIWARDGRVSIRDLGSRNGSWVRLPSETTLTVPGEHDLHLRLGFQPSSSKAERSIDPPRYEDPGELGGAMAREIERWVAETGIQVRVSVGPSDRQPSGAVRLPIASGETLEIQAAHTIDDQYSDLLVTIARYVAAQNAIFVAEQATRSDGIILASAAIRQVHRRVVDSAMRNVSRLILLGPSGTGKERLATAYHRHLGRSGPLVTVNCATLTRERLVADLFGAEAGAYTGAQRAVIGAVERADGGTLFLDEIGEMPLEVQSQLLRFLDTGEYQRLGSTGVSRHADVHIVAATNRDLRAMVHVGTFRLDLFFRLALEVIEVPSLRERFKDAIAYLASSTLGNVSALDALEPAALELLRQHTWAGNFRELVNLVRRLPRNSGPGSIDVASIRNLLAAGALITPPSGPPETPVSTGDWTEWLRDSADLYRTDTATTGPTTWSEMTTFIEQYLKPHALVHMAGVASAASADAIAASKVADTIKADRGTVVKQLRRYFETRR